MARARGHPRLRFKLEKGSFMKRSVGAVSAVALLILSLNAHAEWKGKGEGGIVFARGNTSADTINLKLELTDKVDKWEHKFGIAALQAKTDGKRIADRLGATWQSSYAINARSFWFGGLRYEKDTFSGFQYQSSLTAGYGYKFIDTDATKFKGQVGAGYKTTKLSIAPFSSSSSAIVRGDLNYEHVLSSTTKVTNDFIVELGGGNQFMSDDLALQVKMSEKLALSVGIGTRYNSKPPGKLKRTDTVTTLNLVYSF
jgi:putative salt-induced outer membrane protein